VALQAVLLAGLLAMWLAWGAQWGVASLAAGATLAGAGTVLAGGGLLSLGRHLSPYPTPRRDAALVERGAYRLVRHPIYGGLLLGSLGLSVADGNWPGLVVSLGLAVLFWGKSGFEERRLLAHFPGYAAYRARVRCRLLPWVL